MSHDTREKEIRADEKAKRAAQAKAFVKGETVILKDTHLRVVRLGKKQMELKLIDNVNMGRGGAFRKGEIVELKNHTLKIILIGKSRMTLKQVPKG